MNRNQNTLRCIFYSSLLWLGFTYGLMAQQTFKPELALGARMGYQFSLVNFDSNISQRLHAGYTTGLVLQYLSQKQIGIQLEVSYSQRGLSAPQTGQTLTVHRDFDYIEIPFLTHFAIGKKRFRIVVNAGSYLSFLIDSQQANSSNAEDYYLLPLAQQWTFGLMGGLGLAFRSGIGVFQLEGRGAVGFTDLFSTNIGDQFNSSPELFFGAQFSYLYPIGKKTTKKDTIPDESSTTNF